MSEPLNRGQNAPNPFGTLGGPISGWAWFHICSGEEYCDQPIFADRFRYIGLDM